MPYDPQERIVDLTRENASLHYEIEHQEGEMLALVTKLAASEARYKQLGLKRNDEIKKLSGWFVDLQRRRDERIWAGENYVCQHCARRRTFWCDLCDAYKKFVLDFNSDNFEGETDADTE